MLASIEELMRRARKVTVDASEPEYPLDGGSRPGVVRVGATVRRPPAPGLTCRHAFLAHLAAGGFKAAPKPLGVDDDGREVVSFVAGEVPGPRPWPAFVWSTSTIVGLGGLMASLHAAATSFVPPPQCQWAPLLTAGSVMCHNDIGPTNVVFRQGEPMALIDWDHTRPGDRLDDVAHAAWWFVPLVHHDLARTLGGPTDPAQVDERLAILCASYGDAEPADIRRRVRVVIESRLRHSTARFDAGDPAHAALAQRGYHSGMRLTLEWLSNFG